MKVQSTAWQWALMAAVVGMAIPMPDIAWAQGATDLNSLVGSINSNEMPAIPLALSTVSYVVGIFLGIRGIMLLKQHAENPTQQNLPKGISAIAAGSAFLALPALTKVLQGTTQLTSGAANFQDFNTTFH